MKPVVFYVDDEPHNLVVFEAALPDDWTCYVFESPMAALERLDEFKPQVIVTDQRMPHMTGVQFLEVARKIAPDAIRIIVTGYSDEDLVVESVRKARIFDYIKKPWQVDDLISSLTRAFDFYKAEFEGRRLQEELIKREVELRETNAALTSTLKDLEIAQLKETDLRAELECWVPPFVSWALKEAPLNTQSKRDVVGITFDIIGSGRIHDMKLSGRPIRSHIIQVFSEAVIRHDGWRESHSGDSAYGHFGLLGAPAGTELTPSESALAAAREFRVALRSLGDVSGTAIECGIALHVARECQIHVHTVHLNTTRGPVTQKSFDTSSSDVDLLHRIEKLVHRLPGSNIVMSRVFVDSLKTPPPNLVELGKHMFTGQKDPVELLLIPSDLVKPEHLNALRADAVDTINEGSGVVSVPLNQSSHKAS